MNKTINQQIIKLEYDPSNILAFKGETFENVVPNSDQIKDGKYIVVHREKGSASQKNYDIAIVNATTDRTYPSAILLANEALVNNMPTLLAAKRAPITIHINLPGLEEDGTCVVEDPKNSTVSQAINKITKSWLKNNKDFTIPANCSYSETKVFSKDHLKVATGFDLSEKISLDFKSAKESKKQIFVMTFKQIFYTVSIDVPEHPGGFFDEDEEWQTLVDNGVGNNAPPVYVANVAYGRTIYVTTETTNMSSEIESKIEASIKGGKFDASVLKDSELENCEYSAYVLGGNAGESGVITNKNLDDIRKLVNNNTEFSANNPGSPISYTTVFLKENQIAKINSSTEYIETTYTEYSSCSIRLVHSGAYIAKFYVDWQERSFDEEGDENLKKCHWEKNGKSLTAHFETVIPLPANATNIHIKATEKTGLVWEPWRTVIDQDVKLMPNIKASIKGTTLHPKGKVEYK